MSWQPLEAHLDGLHRQNRERSLRDWTPGPRPGTVQVEGRTLLDLASNDYLGLARHIWTPRLPPRCWRGTSVQQKGARQTRRRS